MSEPFFFTADVINPSRMVIHAVVFTSFEESSGSSSEIKICAEDADPRMREFIKFVWVNFLKEQKSAFDKLVKQADARESELRGLKKKLEDLQKLYEARTTD